MSLKEKIGTVISNKMNKTVVVFIENKIAHYKYNKIMIKTKRYKVHDENNECKIGDIVKIQETRPLSKTKRWQVIDIIRHCVIWF
uniref:Small ribosomal subunit protein uS17c n=1 Tax=Corynoplastis japonica TaxID=700918 RepID=A0A1X9PU06_9RHOD|nr:30S ribosomal protein S17 [Corynoplastis japonica]